MQLAGFPSDEVQRLDALRELGLLYTPPEERFDRISRLVMRLFDVPIAFVSLIDSNRQWFKSCYGMNITETDREVSFCGHTILQDEHLVIPNALEDPRFADNPLVLDEPYIRFYAGHVLRGPGKRKVGTLCMISREPRPFGEQDAAALHDIAMIAERELNSAEAAELQKQLVATMTLQRAILDGVGHAIFSTDLAGNILSFNRAAEGMLGHTAREVIGRARPTLFYEPGELARRTRSPCGGSSPSLPPEMASLVSDASIGIAREKEWSFVTKQGRVFPVSVSVTPLASEAGTVTGFLWFASDVTERMQAAAALDAARQAQERLLLNILPAAIADRLKTNQDHVAESLPEVTILFAELHEFPRLTSGMTAAESVALLNEIITSFDALVQQRGLEKIKTIANAYMVAGGAPVARADHAEAVADLALAMQREIAKWTSRSGEQFNLRIGIKTGPVVAGVIGKTKFSYDLWGETVATAWEMTTLGSPGDIQVDEATEHGLRNRYAFEKRGDYYIKDKGIVQIWFLKGRRSTERERTLENADHR